MHENSIALRASAMQMNKVGREQKFKPAAAVIFHLQIRNAQSEVSR
jgi:hypothetical protein